VSPQLILLIYSVR